MQGQVKKDMSPEENAIYESIIKEVIHDKKNYILGLSGTFLAFV